MAVPAHSTIAPEITPLPSRRMFLRFAGVAPVAAVPVAIGAYPPPRAVLDDGPMFAEDALAIHQAHRDAVAAADARRAAKAIMGA